MAWACLSSTSAVKSHWYRFQAVSHISIGPSSTQDKLTVEPQGRELPDAVVQRRGAGGVEEAQRERDHSSRHHAPETVMNQVAL